MTRMLAGVLALGLALLAGGEAFANGGKDRGIPAPIPVPAPVPIPEGFSYYLRGDLGWAFVASAPSFSESGAEYGALPLSFGGLSNQRTGIDDVFIGTIGGGVYLTPNLRADATLDFRGTQDVEATATYIDAGPIAGSVRETVKLRSTVGLINAYWDLFPRGHFSPYVGAGIGIVYNDIHRRHLTTEDDGTPPIATVNSGANSETGVGLAAALMAGVTLARDHRWAVDINYRALYLDGGSVTTLLSSGDSSRIEVGDHWEHQIRIGVRANIW